MSRSTSVPLDLVATFLNAIFVCLFLIVAHILECLGHFSISCNPCSFCIISTIQILCCTKFNILLQNAQRPTDYSDDMDEDLLAPPANTLSKKQVNGTKSIMRPSRKTAEEHNKSRAKMLAVANAASKNGQ